MRTFLASLIVAAGLSLAPPALAQPAVATGACAASGGLSFICGVESPEDLKPIAGTRWMIVSGMQPGAGLKLVDTDAKTALKWNASPYQRVQRDARTYPACATPPDPARFESHGLSLRAIGDGRYRLHVVGHTAREGVEVYEVDARPSVPTLTWVGCIPATDGLIFNAVATFSDGEVLATVLFFPDLPAAARTGNGPTGAVYRWTPGQAGFSRLPGTELAIPNGVETSRDDRSFYVVSYKDRTVSAFARGDAPRLLGRSASVDFSPDNIGWSGDWLIFAGDRHDEPACGGPRKFGPGQAECNHGYVAARLDPATLAVSAVAYAEPNPDYSWATTGVVVGDTLWLGSARGDRLAYRPLPRPK